MKTTIKTIISISLLLALLNSCQNSTTQMPLIENVPSSGIWVTWLSLSDCKTPCWQGITPGVTTASEAISILEKMEGVKIKYHDKNGMTWDFNDNTEGGEVRFSEDLVASVSLSSTSKRKLLLETVIKAHNVPKYIVPYDCREGSCITVLVYPDMGIVLSVFVPNVGSASNPKVEIRATTTIDRVYFLKEGFNLFMEFPELQQHELLEWTGYSKYP